MKINICN